jgi:broad specificity phosphatase PhoE
MILTLMRHPPTNGESETCLGQTNVELSLEGQTALIPLVGEACRLRPDQILCSDLKRCQVLAEAIAGRLGLFAESDPIWREVNFGTWENRTWSDIQAREPQVLSEWMANFDTVAPPGGESFQQLQARVLKGIENKILGDTGETPVPRSEMNTGRRAMPHCLVVTHAGVIRAAVSAFSRLPLRKAFELAVPYGSHTSFRRHGNRWSPLDIVAGRRSLSPKWAP